MFVFNSVSIRLSSPQLAGLLTCARQTLLFHFYRSGWNRALRVWERLTLMSDEERVNELARSDFTIDHMGHVFRIIQSHRNKYFK
jgi:hypothetical protein